MYQLHHDMYMYSLSQPSPHVILIVVTIPEPPVWRISDYQVSSDEEKRKDPRCGDSFLFGPAVSQVGPTTGAERVNSQSVLLVRRTSRSAELARQS
jgi:hypothetical protein